MSLFLLWKTGKWWKTDANMDRLCDISLSSKTPIKPHKVKENATQTMGFAYKKDKYGLCRPQCEMNYWLPRA